MSHLIYRLRLRLAERRALTIALTVLVLVALTGAAVLALKPGSQSGHQPQLPLHRGAVLPSYESLVATATGTSVPVYAAPIASTPTQTFPNPWLLNGDPHLPVPLVFSVVQRHGSWLQVLLPVRPNGSTGWVHASDVTLTADRYRVEVSLAAHQISVYDANTLIYQGPVATGAPATPTPTGRYFLWVLIKAPDPTTVYGPYAYGLSGYSPTLQTFEGSDAEVGIHGNNDTSVLGQSITHGCVRMANDAISTLSGVLPLGTPVQINA